MNIQDSSQVGSQKLQPGLSDAESHNRPAPCRRPCCPRLASVPLLLPLLPTSCSRCFPLPPAPTAPSSPHPHRPWVPHGCPYPGMLSHRQQFLTCVWAGRPWGPELGWTSSHQRPRRAFVDCMHESEKQRESGEGAEEPDRTPPGAGWPPLTPHYPRCKHAEGSLEKRQPVAG